MSILLRYLVKELWVPLVVWLSFLFVILFVMQLLRGTDVLLGSAVRPEDIGKLMFFLAPHFLVMALPVAFLLAILLGLGRLGEDRELVAMASLGMSPWQVVWIPAVGGVALGGVMLLMYFTAEPWGLAKVKEVANEVIKKNVVGDVKAGEFYEDFTELTLYVEGVDPVGHQWRNVLIHDNRDPSSPLLVLAREGRLNPSAPGEAVRVSLWEGRVHRADRSTFDYAVVEFERGDISVGVEGMFLKQSRFRWSDAEYTPAQLLQAAREADARGENGRPLRMAFHWRLGQILAPLSFAVLGTPLAISRRQGGRARGFLLALLAYVGYYVLSRFFDSQGTQGKLPMLLAGQLPNLVFIGLGLWAMRRVNQAGNAR